MWLHIDPVFDPLGNRESTVHPVGYKMYNWYQKNSISEPTVLEDCSGEVVGCPGGISCGRRIGGDVIDEEVEHRRDGNGDPLLRSCPFYNGV